MLQGNSLSGRVLLTGSRRQRRGKLGASYVTRRVAFFIEAADELAKFGPEAKSLVATS